MSVKRTSSKPERVQPFDPTSTGTLNASETLKLLALPDTSMPQSPEDLGLDALHRATFVQLPLGVGYATREGRLIWCNEAFELMLGLNPGEYREKRISELTHQSESDSTDELLRDLWAGRIKSYSHEKRYVKRGGTELWVRVSAAIVRTAEGNPVCSVGFVEDISARKKMEVEIERVQKELVDTSRQAGMAEVATNVLHNVGNVLNSVNVAASVLGDKLKSSKGARLGEVATLLTRHQHDMAGFMARDPRARKIPAYLTALSAQLGGEREAMLKELDELRGHIDHIKETVSMQQTYARRCGVLEEVSVTEMIEDALRMNSGALARHKVALKTDFIDRPQITTDKHKALQILVNLLRNAKHACDESGREDKLVSVRVESILDTVSICVTDNGVGIAPEVMPRLFNHGFTTRKSGHGFGLHGAALAASDLGGTLSAHSDGPGLGATFRLILPFHVSGTVP
ncbi:MAG TPA: PAS domain S-box protein [Steroidobacteraceae bacterium]|nr:PAS domain S-box protein [Steroidobacteraceae bacterium]